eukprot:scaffold102131_cov43-Prasinocladus_malaysianus.AAC.1
MDAPIRQTPKWMTQLLARKATALHCARWMACWSKEKGWVSQKTTLKQAAIAAAMRSPKATCQG